MFPRKRATLAALVSVLGLGLSVAGAQTVVYVDDGALGGDGTTWATAYKYLQDALWLATPGDEIHVAAGTYKPDHDVGGNVVPGDRNATFQLINSVTLMGGYRGLGGGGSPDDRDIKLFETVLNGDLDGNDVPDFAGFVACLSGDHPIEPGCGAFDLDGDGHVETDDGRMDENSFHVVTGSGTDWTAGFDGFTITHGYAGAPENVGGGMLIGLGSPTVTRCTFAGNVARFFGGGMFLSADGDLSISDCVFHGNVASLGGGIIVYPEEAQVMLVNCLFEENRATWLGFWVGVGGAMLIYDGPLLLVNCTFSANSATDSGGGVSCYSEQASLLSINSILWGNVTDYGPSQIACTETGVAYSCVQGWTEPGEGNITDNPLFVDADGPDNNPDTWEDNDHHLSPSSPCIDAGMSAIVIATGVQADLDGKPRRIDDPETPDTGLGPWPIVDMGAYEYFPDCNNNGIPDICDRACSELGGACGLPACGGSADCNENGIPDECDIADGTSNDINGNGAPDECECGDDPDCNDADKCTEDTCEPQNPDADIYGCVSVYRPRVFGNIVPEFCPPDCSQPDLADITCVLDDFADGPAAGGCGTNDPPDSTDLSPCGGNGVLDVDDILSELDAFGQVFACPHPCQ